MDHVLIKEEWQQKGPAKLLVLVAKLSTLIKPRFFFKKNCSGTLFCGYYPDAIKMHEPWSIDVDEDDPMDHMAD